MKNRLLLMLLIVVMTGCCRAAPDQDVDHEHHADQLKRAGAVVTKMKKMKRMDNDKSKKKCECPQENK